MYSNHDIVKIDAECAEIRKGRLKALDKRYAAKREYEAKIKAALANGNPKAWCRITFEAVQGPYTIVELTGYTTDRTESGLGIARCWKRDKNKPDEGWDIAMKKARRILARKLAG
jgi:hypothetical protein